MQPEQMLAEHKLRGQIALVTGASKGIGRATAILLAELGATVYLCARDGSQLAELSEQIRPREGVAHSAPADLEDETAVQALFARIRREQGGLDILVNNAGMAPMAPLEEMSVATFRDCMELNVVAVFHCMKRAVELMRSGGGGKIINVGSVRSHWTEGGDAGAYNASKFALRGLTETVARQLHGTGANIAVGMVCPGIVDTSLTNPTGAPQPDWLRPEDVAAAIVHALQAPRGVNVFDTVLFPTTQKPW